MERRVTSHTEEEEMNQRRHLLTLARKGDQKAVSKLMELYQVKVYSGNSLKSLKIRKLPAPPSTSKTKAVLPTAKKPALRSLRPVARKSESVSSKPQKSSRPTLSKKGKAHKVKPVKALGEKKKIVMAKSKPKGKVKPKKKLKIQARLKSKALAKAKKSQIKAKVKGKVRLNPRVQSSAKAKGRAKTKKRISSKSASASRVRVKVTPKAKLARKNKRRK